MSDALVQIGSPAARPMAEIGAEPRDGGRPAWLRIRLSTPQRYHEIKRLVGDLNLP